MIACCQSGVSPTNNLPIAVTFATLRSRSCTSGAGYTVQNAVNERVNEAVSGLCI